MNAVTQKARRQDPDPRETRDGVEAIFSAECDVWWCPRLVDSRRDGFDFARRTPAHSEAKEQRFSYVTRCFAEHERRVLADKIRGFIPGGGHYPALGTDGCGRSDTPPNLRNSFEINRRWIAHAAFADRAWRDDLAGLRERNRDLKTQTGHAECVDSVSANIQQHVLAEQACVDFIFRNATTGSDLSW